MRKYFVIALCAVVIIGVIFVVIDKNKEENNASHFAFTTQQKTAIKKAKMSGGDLSDAEVDTFTIGQGKLLLDQYLKKHDPLFFRFHLKQSTLDKTIKEIRLEN